jgi:hypothetical protein
MADVAEGDFFERVRKEREEDEESSSGQVVNSIDSKKYQVVSCELRVDTPLQYPKVAHKILQVLSRFANETINDER